MIHQQQKKKTTLGTSELTFKGGKAIKHYMESYKEENVPVGGTAKGETYNMTDGGNI